MTGPATDPIKRAEEDTLALILSWVNEVLQGRGESIAQMVVSVVLGCIPGVGQAIDAYNILRYINALIQDVDNADNWIELVLCLVAFVPILGDALKLVFNGIRSEKRMGRILDSLPNTSRGNIEKWFRELNWGKYASEMKNTVSKIINEMIEALDTRVTKWVMDRQGVDKLVRQLRSLQSVASKKIDEAMNSLKTMHQSSLRDPLPNTSAHVPASPSAARTTTPGSKAPGSVRTPTSPTATPASGKAAATQRQSTRAQQSRARTGVSAEHITDYYYVRRQHSRHKVNKFGELYEMTQKNHHGIDHIWHGESAVLPDNVKDVARLARRGIQVASARRDANVLSKLPHGYRISDTKGTVGAFHKLETAKAVFEGLSYGIDA